MARAKLLRADIKFAEDLEQIKIRRRLDKRDMHLLSDRRLTKAIRNLSDWELIKSRLIEANIENDRFNKK